MSEITVADGIGLLGAVIIVTTYFLLQVGRLESTSVSYSVANGLGAAAIIFSLFYEFNLSAFAIESFWLAISLYGIYRAVRSRSSLARDAMSSEGD